MRGMSQANLDLGIFQETKLTGGVYTRGSAGYSFVATDAPSRHRGGVAVFYRPSPQYAVKAIQKFGPNIFGFKLTMGERRWYIVGCYLSPEGTSTIESVIAALKERPRGLGLVVTGDFNANLENPEGDQSEDEIAVALTMVGLEDIPAHLLPRRRPWCQDGRT